MRAPRTPAPFVLDALRRGYRYDPHTDGLEQLVEPGTRPMLGSVRTRYVSNTCHPCGWGYTMLVDDALEVSLPLDFVRAYLKEGVWPDEERAQRIVDQWQRDLDEAIARDREIGDAMAEAEAARARLRAAERAEQDAMARRTPRAEDPARWLAESLEDGKIVGNPELPDIAPGLPPQGVTHEGITIHRSRDAARRHRPS